MQNHGPWKILHTDSVYRDPYVEVTRDDVIRPDGKPGTHVKVFMKPGVSVLAMDAQKNVYLTHEFHYAIGRYSTELASGGIEKGESALSTAQRELREELGIVANDWLDLGSVHPFTTIIESPTQLYLATDLTFTESAPEGTELIDCVKMKLSEAIDKVLAGEIFHAPSCVAILKSATLVK
jgi:ADP-ribose pyrophosphatase